MACPVVQAADMACACLYCLSMSRQPMSSVAGLWASRTRFPRGTMAGNAGVLLSSVPRAAILREAPALAVGRFTSRTPHRLREEPARSICLRQKELFLPHFFVKKALLFFCIPVQPCSLSDSLTELKLGSYLAAFRYGPKDKRSRPHGAAPLFQRCAIRSLP